MGDFSGSGWFFEGQVKLVLEGLRTGHSLRIVPC